MLLNVGKCTWKEQGSISSSYVQHQKQNVGVVVLTHNMNNEIPLCDFAVTLAYNEQSLWGKKSLYFKKSKIILEEC